MNFCRSCTVFKNCFGILSENTAIHNFSNLCKQSSNAQGGLFSIFIFFQYSPYTLFVTFEIIKLNKWLKIVFITSLSRRTFCEVELTSSFDPNGSSSFSIVSYEYAGMLLIMALLQRFISFDNKICNNEMIFYTDNYLTESYCSTQFVLDIPIMSSIKIKLLNIYITMIQ